MVNQFFVMNAKHPPSIFSDEDLEFTWDNNEDYHYPLVNKLKYIYWGETYLLRVYNKIIKSVDSIDLKKIFTIILNSYQQSLERLEQIFIQLEEVAKGKKCDVMDCLINNTLLILKKNHQKNLLRDVDLALSFRQILIVKIANQKELIDMEDKLDDDQIISLLKENIEEDKQHLELLIYFAKDDLAV